ncbi:MAG: tetratricopeptide repeat protein [bacterium]|nr:tetratricopeptide repeat protein [bacterium]
MLMLMVLLLAIIALMILYIYLFHFNPEAVALIYYWDHSISGSLAVFIICSILAGLLAGLLIHILFSASYKVASLKLKRRYQRNLETSRLYRQGLNKYLSGEPEEAQRLLEKVLDRDPARIDAHITLSDVHIGRGRLQDAVGTLTHAREQNPDCLEVLFKLASVYELMGKNDETEKIYETILQEEKNNRTALERFREYLVRQKLWGKALELQRRLVKITTGARLDEEKQRQQSLRYELAWHNLQRNNFKNSRAEQRELMEILRETPDFVPARMALSEVCKAEDHIREAAQALQEGYLATGKSVFLTRLEELYLKTEDPSALLLFYRSALEGKSRDLLLHFFYGRLCLRLEMVEEAIEQLTIVESADVELPQLYLLLADAYRRRNRFDESYAAFQKLLHLSHATELELVCEKCGAKAYEWVSRCPQCGAWSSYALADRKVFQKVTPAVEISGLKYGRPEGRKASPTHDKQGE